MTTPTQMPTIRSGNPCADCRRMQVMEELYQIGNRESADIRFCLVCGQIYYCRWQFDPGTGSDNIILMPGEQVRYHSFTEAAARKAIEKWTPTGEKGEGDG